MRPLDFIQTARDLVEIARSGRPRETNLRRASSAAYYAMFHCLAESCANALAGATRASRSQQAWRQAYRALNHSSIRRRSSRREFRRFPIEIREFAALFISMQAKRHKADYDPYPDIQFTKSEALHDIIRAEDAIIQFGKVTRNDRRAFAIYLLMDIRND